MRQAVATLTLLFATSVQILAQQKPETMVSTIEPWWAMISKSFISVADAMPADKYSFKPKDGAFDNVRTFAEQVKHVACANYALFNEIEGKTPPRTSTRLGLTTLAIWHASDHYGQIVVYLRLNGIVPPPSQPR